LPAEAFCSPELPAAGRSCARPTSTVEPPACPALTAPASRCA
jgi:hypothetical protein